MYGHALMIGFESNHEGARDSHPYQTEIYIKNVMNSVTKSRI